MVGLIGLEPMTPALSRRCSNQLSYRPIFGLAALDFEFFMFNLEFSFKIQHLPFKIAPQALVEVRRLELLTSSLQS